jgi:hypothetical protein
LVKAAQRRFARKGERGATVVIVVMVTTLLAAIGVLAVRNISQVDQAAGYGRQSNQTMALAEMGTTVAAAQLAYKKVYYLKEMDNPLLICQANQGLLGRNCYPLSQQELDTATTGLGGRALLEPAVAGTDTGSFGPVANVSGFVDVEVTDIHRANLPQAGEDLEKTPFDATLTTTARVVPSTPAAAPCAANISIMTVKKVMRAHVIF